LPMLSGRWVIKASDTVPMVHIDVRFRRIAGIADVWDRIQVLIADRLVDSVLLTWHGRPASNWCSRTIHEYTQLKPCA
jgi:hypothetical protein